MPYCENCGYKYEHEKRFCNKCGAKLNSKSSETSVENHVLSITADNSSRSLPLEENKIYGVNQDKQGLNEKCSSKNNISNLILIIIPIITFVLWIKSSISLRYVISIILLGYGCVFTIIRSRQSSKEISFSSVAIKVSALIFGIALLVATYLTNKSSNSIIVNISIQDYFPKNQMILVYNSYGPEEKIASINQINVYPKKIDDTLWEVTYKGTRTGELFNWNSVDYLDVYQVKDGCMKQTYLGGGPLNVSRNISSVVLCNKPQWKIDDESTAKITRSNLNISTKAGEFSNCIEVTKETMVKGEKYPTMKIYYAPNIGKILELIENENSKYIKWTELISTASDNTVSSIQSDKDEGVKKNNYYSFILKDTKGVEHEVNIYSEDANESIITDDNASTIASKGDKTITGHFKISYGEKSEKNLKIEELKDWISDKEDNILTLNLSKNLVCVVENNYSDQPDFLLIGRADASMVSFVQVYFIKDSKLNVVGYKGENENTNYIPTCDSEKLFFKQVGKDEFEISAYNNSEGVFYITTLKFNINNEQLESKGFRKMSVNEYNAYKDSDSKNTVKDRNSINNTNELLYINKEYSFNVTIPKSWEGHYVVKEGHWAPEAEKTLDFNFVYDNKEYCNIFSIIILKKNFSKGIDENYSSDMWKYIATNKDIIFKSSQIAELPSEFYTEKYESLKNMLIKMVNEDTPKILKTFKIN